MLQSLMQKKSRVNFTVLQLNTNGSRAGYKNKFAKEMKWTRNKTYYSCWSVPISPFHSPGSVDRLAVIIGFSIHLDTTFNIVILIRIIINYQVLKQIFRFRFVLFFFYFLIFNILILHSVFICDFHHRATNRTIFYIAMDLYAIGMDEIHWPRAPSFSKVIQQQQNQTNLKYKQFGERS